MNKLRTNKTNIAIINNDITQAKQLGFSLKNLGYNVNQYSNPDEIFYDNNLENTDLVIIDMDLPQLNGFNFYKELKHQIADKKIYVFSF
jgi:PleD family two-component response regulator